MREVNPEYRPFQGWMIPLETQAVPSLDSGNMPFPCQRSGDLLEITHRLQRQL
jgi:hypothetical protein